MKSIYSVTTSKQLQQKALSISKETLENNKSLSELISAVFNAGLESKQGLSRLFRAIKTFVIMFIGFILHGIGELTSLLDRQVTNLLLVLGVIFFTENAFIPFNMLVFFCLSITVSAWKMVTAPLLIAADILDLFTYSLTRLLDNWSASPGIAFIFSLIPTLLMALGFIGLISLGAVSAIFAWPVIAIVAVGIGIGLLTGSLGVEFVKPFDDNLVASNVIYKTIEEQTPYNHFVNTLVSPGTSSVLINTVQIDKGEALRRAIVGAQTTKFQKLPTLDELLEDSNLIDFIEQKNSRGQTALHLAVIKYNKEYTVDSYRIIKSLLQHGASYAIKDKTGKTAFEYYDNAKILCELLKNDGITNLPVFNDNVSTDYVSNFDSKHK
jgi:hypothetical protein